METNSLQRRRTYQCWQDMKGRCYNMKAQQYKNYGARGIKVCDRWLTSFENFVADMGYKPDGLTLAHPAIGADTSARVGEHLT